MVATSIFDVLIYLSSVLIVSCFVLYYYFTRTYNYWKERNVVGPKPVPFYGNLKDSTLRKKNMSVVIQEYYDMFPKEKVVGVYRMTTPCLLIRDLDLIKQIMIKDFDAFKDRGVSFSDSGLGQNLFHSDGDTWSALRTRFTPIYTSGNLKNMYPILKDRANLFMKNFKIANAKNPEFEVYSLVQKYTISSIFAAAFGVDVDYFYGGVDDTLKYVDKMILTPNYAHELDMMYPGLLKSLNMSLFPATIKTFFDKLVNDIITQRDGKPTSRGDFMDLILQLRQMGELSGSKNREGTENKVLEITDNVISAQAFVFYVAGYETSATTVSFLLYYLAMNPDMQEKLIHELDAMVEENGGEITYDSLMNLKYLEKLIKETLRINPVGDPLMRKAVVDYKVPDSDLVIKKDQVVLVSVRGLHYDEEIYPNPTVFDPSRFDADVEGARHSCAYLPFGTGPRMCIGMRFATVQSRLCVAAMLLKYRVVPCERTEKVVTLDPNRLVNSPKNGLPLKFVPREMF